MCVCVCVFIKLHITTQSGPVILVILCVCVCVVIPLILDVRLAGAPAGVTQDFSAFLLRCFVARRIQPSLSPVESEVEFCGPTDCFITRRFQSSLSLSSTVKPNFVDPRINRSPWA